MSKFIRASQEEARKSVEIMAGKEDHKISGKTKFSFSEDQREEIARIIEIVARDGLPEPRDLDVALDAIECALQ